MALNKCQYYRLHRIIGNYFNFYKLYRILGMNSIALYYIVIKIINSYKTYNVYIGSKVTC